MNVIARSSNDSRADKITDSKPDSPASLVSSAGPSLISDALAIVGHLESAGDIRIDGKVEGDIRGRMVTIASSGTVKGTVFGEGVELAGIIEGKIEARHVVLTKTARMRGDIIHESLKIDQGACFSGVSRPQYEKHRS